MYYFRSLIAWIVVVMIATIWVLISESDRAVRICDRKKMSMTLVVIPFGIVGFVISLIPIFRIVYIVFLVDIATMTNLEFEIFMLKTATKKVK